MKHWFWMVAALLALPQASSADDLTSSPDDSRSKPYQFGRSRTYDLKHQLLTVDIDIPHKSIAGTSTLTLSPLTPDVKRIWIDAQDLTIDSVTADAAPASFERGDSGLWVNVPSKKPTETMILVVKYHGSPKKGLHFVAPDEVWSQGESELSHFWFPTYDFPNDRTTSEMIVTTDANLVAISNGKLLDVKESGGKKTWHYREEVSHVTYLVSLAIGPYDVVKDQAGTVPLEYVVPRGTASRAKDIFGKTAEWIAALTKETGVPYPYEKYAQVAVRDFTHGGMENISATTLNEYVMYPASQSETWVRRVDGLLAHEVVHQWYGDLLTCESWNHTWLNEGFATYYAARMLGASYGPDGFLFQMDTNAQTVIGSSSSRPTINFLLASMDDSFGENVYQRGAWILHMLRRKLGEERFTRSIQAYTKEFREKTVDSSDFRRLVERETGQDLKEFFFKWVERGGFLDVTANWTWDDDSRSIVLDFIQAPVTGTTDLFYNVPLDVDLVTDKGNFRKVVRLEGANTRVTFAAETKPLSIRFDPEHNWLRRIKTNRKVSELAADLLSTSPTWVRLDAARDLGDRSTPESIEALGKTLRSDSFWAIRQVAANSLGKIATPGAWDVAISGMQDPSAMVRLASVSALSNDRRPATRTALVKAISSEKLEMVLGEIGRVLALSRRPEDLSTLKKLLDRKSHMDSIQVGVYSGIKEAGFSEALSLAKAGALESAPRFARPSAIEAIGSIGSYADDKRDFYETLLPFMQDPIFRNRRAAATALGTLGDRRGRAPLQQMADNDSDGTAQRLARDAIGRLAEGRSPTPGMGDLRKKIDEMTKTQEELKKRIEILETAPKAAKAVDKAPGAK